MLEKKFGFFSRLGMEDNGESALSGAVLDEPVNTEDILHPEETVEAELLEVEEQKNEIATGVAKTDDLVNDMETLENVAIALESASYRGGISVSAVDFARMTVQPIIKKWGMDNPIPSMESFEDGKRLEATTISMEGIKEVLKDFWKALVASISRLFDKFVSWVRSIFDTSVKIRKRAEDVLQRVQASDFTVDEKRQVDVPSLWSHALTTGRVDYVMHSLELIKTYTNNIVAGDLGSSIDRLMVKGIDYISDMRALGENTNARQMINAMEVQYKEIERIAFQSIAEGPSIHIRKTDDIMVGDRKWVSIRTNGKTGLPGDRMLNVAYRLPKGYTNSDAVIPLSDIYDSVGNFSISLNHDKKPVGKPDKLPALPKASMIDALKIVIHVCEKIRQFKQTYNARRSALSKLDGDISKLITFIDKDEKLLANVKNEATRSVRHYGYAMTKLYRSLVDFDTNWTSYALRMCNSIIRYVELSAASTPSSN